MSSSHHDDHHSAEAKPVSFTVPFILASVLLIIMLLFVSLCDPKHGAHGDGEEHGHGHNAAAMEAPHHDVSTGEDHNAAAAAEPAMHDSTAAPAIAPEVEGKPAAEEAHH